MDQLDQFIIATIAISSIMSFAFMKALTKLHSLSNVWLRWLAAGTLPTLLIIACLFVRDHFEYIEYLKGPQEGWMSPLVGLIYGFPYFVANLVINFLAAGYAGHRR